MKKVIVSFQILVLLMFLAKIIANVEGVRQITGDGENVLAASVALAQAPVAPAAPAAQPQKSPRDSLGDSLTKERTLETALQAKLRLLEQREESLKMEEQRLQALKQELTEKIETFRALQEQIATVTEDYKKQIATVTEVFKTEEGKRIKELARVYEAMPPAKAGVMLENLDIQTAAGITMNMKRDKAGSIWGYLSPKKAVEITEEITRSLKAAAEKKS